MTTTPRDAARRLAVMIAESAAERMAGRPGAVDAAVMHGLVATLAAGGIDAMFAALGEELRARGATLPPLDHWPPGIAALLESAQDALDLGGGPLDFEVAADKLDRAVHATTGTSPRQARAQALRERIRREVSTSIARSMRAHGLTPAADLKDDGAPLDDDDEPAKG